MKKALVLLVVMLAARWLPAQGTADSWAPLLVSTNGPGSISPYQSGQMLQVGKPYIISATPNPGGRFVSWQETKKVVEVKTIFYPSDAIVITTNTTVSTLRVHRNPKIHFIMEPLTVQVRDDQPGTSVITESFEWQANFTGSTTQ